MADPTQGNPQPSSDLAGLFLQPKPTAVVPEESAAQRPVGPYVDPWKLSTGETFQRTAELDHTVPAIIRLGREAGFEPTDWQMPAEGSEEFKSLTEGIPEEQWPRIFGGAVSLEHAQYLHNEIKEENATEQLLAEHGAGGIGTRLLFDAMDPVSFALSVGTGGLGVAAKAARLERAARLAEEGAMAARAAKAAGAAEKMAGAVKAADEASNAAKAISLGKVALQRGGIAAGEGAVLAEINREGTPTRDGWDVVHAALGSFVLGAGATGIFGRSEIRAIRDGIEGTRSRLHIAELSDHIDAKKAEILDLMAKDPAVTNLKHAQDDLAAYQQELNEAFAKRQDDLKATAKAGPNQNELYRANKEAKLAEKARADAEGSLDDIRARLLREDTEIHGDAATSPQLTKLREKVAKRDWEAAKQSADDRLLRAQQVSARASAAEGARKALRDMEKANPKSPAEMVAHLAQSDRETMGGRLSALEQAVKDAQSKHDAAIAAHEAKLQKLTELQEGGAHYVAGMTPDEASDMADTFGKDSGGAARFTGLFESVNDDAEYPSGAPLGRQAMSRAGRVIGTFGSILRGNENATVRASLGRLVGDTIGTTDGSVSEIGASEIAKRLHKSYNTKFNRIVTPAYDEWAKANGIGMREKWTRPVRDKFMSDVGLAIRGQDITDPHVTGAAKQIASLFDQFRKEAKEAGVKGFEDIESNPHYLPRVFNFKRLNEIEHQIGTPNVKTLFSRAIREANEEIDEKMADRMAHFYVKRMKELRVGSDVGLLQGMRFDDIGWLRKFLSEAGAGSDEVEEIAEKFAQIKKAQNRDNGGDFRNAKRRTQFDENFSMKFKDQTAAQAGRDETVEVKISDLLENNVEALFGRYQRTMSGHIALAKVGIKDHADFAKRIGEVEGALEGNLNELDKVKKTADLVYKLITGQPVEDANTYTKFARFIRDYNYATTMNQAGFSQMPDWAALLGKGYLGYTLKFLPEVVSIVRRARRGELLSDEANLMELWTGLGTDNYNNAVFSSYDDHMAEGFEGVMGKAEHGLRVAGRVTTKISGLGFMNDVATRLAARAVYARLADEAMRGGAISSKRLAQIGLDQSMLKRIRAEISNTTVHADADYVGKQRILNFGAWKDVEARDAMLNGIFREARRMIQEEDLSETAGWMHSSLGKIILQFRRFMTVSYTKQILHGVHMRDAESATQVMVGSALAALSYEMQFGIKYAAMSDGKDKDDFYEKFLTPAAVARAAWARGNYSSFLPATMDSVTAPLFGVRNFDVRGSGLPSDILTGNPTVSTVNGLVSAIGAMAQPLTRSDKQFKKQDANAIRHLIPFQNFIGADVPYIWMTEGLPKRNKDPHPKENDWVWEK